MTKTYTWTTAKGAKVVATITSNHITRETVYADGFNIECDCSKYTYRIARKGKDRVLAVIHEDVVAEVYAEEREETKRKLEAEKKLEDAYNAHCEMMRKAMSY